MARATLGLGVRELAALAGVSQDTVSLERGEALRERTLAAIRSALEARGVEFTDGDRPGGQDCSQSAHGLSRRQVEQHHPIGRHSAVGDCAYGATRRLAFGGSFNRVRGQRASTGAALCARARGGVRSVTMSRVVRAFDLAGP
jgi:hypothetical protein